MLWPTRPGGYQNFKNDLLAWLYQEWYIALEHGERRDAIFWRRMIGDFHSGRGFFTSSKLGFTYEEAIRTKNKVLRRFDSDYGAKIITGLAIGSLILGISMGGIWEHVQQTGKWKGYVPFYPVYYSIRYGIPGLIHLAIDVWKEDQALRGASEKLEEARKKAGGDAWKEPWWGAVPVWNPSSKTYTYMHISEIRTRETRFVYFPDEYYEAHPEETRVGEVVTFWGDVYNPDIKYNDMTGYYEWIGEGEPVSEVLPPASESAHW